MPNPTEKSDFAKKLLKWHSGENTRIMPWKGEKDPYRIWLSEVILQQTRVEQGLAYYLNFIKTFPSINDLALAPDQQVFKLWEGLGYYSRCRNLLATARKIAGDLGGVFPSSYEQIRALKGIGPYTAAAIASFAFDLPHAVVDGNVVRVLSRYFGISTPIDTTSGKKLYAELADSLLDKDAPALYNQAIMDLGATVCKPQNPLCSACVQKDDCQAFRHGWTGQLPVKEKSIQKKKRYMYYFFIETPDDKVYIRQRKEKDIWADLYELVLWETDKPQYGEEIVGSSFFGDLFGNIPLTVRHISNIYRQELTHQSIQGQFISVKLKKALGPVKDYIIVDKGNLSGFAFPKFINAWLLDPTPSQSLF